MKMEISAPKNMKNIHKTFSGQSLIEIVVAVGIIAVVLVGVSDLITRSLGLASFQANKNIAVNIAQNQINHYRLVKDQEPASFFTTNVQALYGDCVGENIDPSKFECTILYNIESNDAEGLPNLIRINVNIKWIDGDNEINTRLSQLLAKPTK